MIIMQIISLPWHPPHPRDETRGPIRVVSAVAPTQPLSRQRLFRFLSDSEKSLHSSRVKVCHVYWPGFGSKDPRSIEPVSNTLLLLAGVRTAQSGGIMIGSGFAQAFQRRIKPEVSKFKTTVPPYSRQILPLKDGVYGRLETKRLLPG